MPHFVFLLTHSLMDTWGCFYFLAIMNNVKHGYPFFEGRGRWYISRIQITGSYGDSMFNFLSNHHTSFHNGYTIVHSHQVPVSPHSHQHLLFLFLILAILMGARWLNPLFSSVGHRSGSGHQSSCQQVLGPWSSWTALPWRLAVWVLGS